MESSVLQGRSGIQLSYVPANGVVSAHVYPRRASNGSLVIVYGHETGLRVVWYAGRKFKPQEDEAPNSNGKSKSNGHGSHDIEVIDLDDSDDESQTTKAPVAATFEAEEEEVDPLEAYRHVLRHLDIHLGAAALHLAQPEASLDSLDANRYPEVLQDNLVVAVACSDLSIRLVTCPLQPPRPELDSPSVVGVQIVKIQHGSAGFHQDFVTSIAMTFTDHQDDSTDDDDQQDSTLPDPEWTFLIASTSDTAAGLLLVHQVSVHGKSLSTDPQDLVLLRRERLRLPLSAARLAFNDSLSASERHSTVLITVPDASCAKIYQVFSGLQSTNNRRKSNATIDSMSSRGSLHNPSSQNGKILLGLVPGFVSSTDASLPARRKRVLDSKWIMGGRAVLALLEDGEFGIWDVEAVGPTSTSANKNPIKGQTNIAGITGASITRFAVAGRFPTAELSSEISKASSVPTALAPATPHTRKLRARGLFQGSDDRPQLQQGDMSTVKGNISVSQISSRPQNESAILSYDSSLVYIPSVAAFWHAAATSGKSFLKVGTYNGPVLLPAVAGINGPLNDIALLPSFSKHHPDDYRTKGIPNFLVSTSTRLVLFVQPLGNGSSAEGAEAGSSSRELVLRGLGDSLAVEKRDLGVDALDRILDKMESSRGLAPASATAAAGAVGGGKAKPNFGKSVGFEDMDVDMISPSPVRFGAAGGSLISSGPMTQRRLFS
ncbi:hypothetical protein DV736_g2970, partial [Chaetothyriales sp. CBS 134916]